MVAPEPSFYSVVGIGLCLLVCGFRMVRLSDRQRLVAVDGKKADVCVLEISCFPVHLRRV